MQRQRVYELRTLFCNIYWQGLIIAYELINKTDNPPNPFRRLIQVWSSNKIEHNYRKMLSRERKDIYPISQNSILYKGSCQKIHCLSMKLTLHIIINDINSLK